MTERNQIISILESDKCDTEKLALIAAVVGIGEMPHPCDYCDHSWAIYGTHGISSCKDDCYELKKYYNKKSDC